MLVVVSTIGKVVSDITNSRRLPPGPGTGHREEIDELRDAVGDLGTRLHKLEEERDFYRELLEAPRDIRKLPPS